jgi:MFS family permease
MKNLKIILILGLAQFVMVLDSTVMNVSISKVVEDLHSTVTAMQGAITFYTLTMAALMLIGAKLGDIWGRKKAFLVGSAVYACGSLITGLSPNMTTLFIGWSVIEGLGAVLVIPAIASLVANNYSGKERVSAYAILGAITGGAVAAGPLIGGFVTTYFSWRYVFFSEVIIMAIVLLLSGYIKDTVAKVQSKIDLLSAIYSGAGLILVVFGMLMSKTWGWILPHSAPSINGHNIEPLGLSVVVYLIIIGCIMIKLFYNRQQKLEIEDKNPLIKVSLLKISQLRSGLGVLVGQYIITAGLFFSIPVYLQMTLGYSALSTGIHIFPLSIGLILFSIVGTKLTKKYSPRKIIRLGQYILILAVTTLLGSVSLTLKSLVFLFAAFFTGAALGLLASQVGNVNMSSVDKKDSSEVGGLQGLFQNLGSSLGTALIGSIFIASLTSSFVGNIKASSLPDNIKTTISSSSKAGIPIIPISEVNHIAESKGVSSTNSATIKNIYSASQISSMRIALAGLIIVSIIALLFSKGIPDTIVK